MSIHEQARAEAEKRWPVGMYHVWDGNLPISSGMFGGIARDSFAGGFLAGHEAATSEAQKWIDLAERNGIRYCLCSRADRMNDRANAECPHHGTGMRQQRDEAATRTRVVTTVAELDALPERTCIVDADMEFHQRHGSLLGRTVESAWLGFLSPTLRSASELRLPARVLYDPEEGR